uniref:Uncharacterized protein n=1 Tax=Anguilla anguilla TaxID=7936 RepID=A0A0E9XUB6_ANGAN
MCISQLFGVILCIRVIVCFLYFLMILLI